MGKTPCLQPTFSSCRKTSSTTLGCCVPRRPGSRGAAEQLYARTRPVVSRAIVRLIRSTTDHDELVQLTMIELIMTLSRFKGQCSLDAWASTLAAHIVFKELRRRRRERAVFSALGDDSPAHTVAAPNTHRALQRDLLERLRGVLESIDRGKAEVFVLHDIHGYDLKETAQILDLTVSECPDPTGSRAARASRGDRRRRRGSPLR